MGWQSCRSSAANVVCHGVFFCPFKNTIVYTESTFGFFVIDNSVKKIENAQNVKTEY